MQLIASNKCWYCGMEAGEKSRIHTWIECLAYRIEQREKEKINITSVTDGEMNRLKIRLARKGIKMLELLKRAIPLIDEIRMVNLIRFQEERWLDEAQKLIAEIEEPNEK